MKKVLSLFLVCFLVFSFVACTESGNKETKTEKKTQEETTKATPESQPEQTKEPSKEAVKENEGKPKVLRVGVTAQYNPWCYQDGEDIVGVDIDILKEVCKRMGNYEIEFTVTSFDGMFGLLDVNKVDTVAEQITVNDTRKEKYIFSVPFAYNPYRLLVHEDNDTIHSLEDLKGKVYVGPPQGQKLDFINNYKAEHDPDDEIKVMSTDNDDIFWIAQKKADATVHAVAPFAGVKKESGLPLKLVGDVVYTEENAYPFNKEADQELIDNFNKALESMKEDGFLSDLYMKYFDVDISTPDIALD